MKLKFFIATFFVFIICCLHASMVLATPFTVNSTTDEVDTSAGDGYCLTASGACSLRAAIQEANAFVGDDEITLPAGTYTLSLIGSGETRAATGDLNVSSNITITGDGMSSTVIDGNGTDRIFYVSNGFLSLSSMELTNGNIADEGGAISSHGSDVELSSVNISGNSAEYNGGGGIYMTSGDLSLLDCIISQNQVGGGGTLGGGGIKYFGSGSVDIANSTISQNTVSGDGSTGSVPSYGGGIYIISGALSIYNSTVSGNATTGNSSGFGGGIGILSGTASIYSSTITSNTTSGNGGGIYINDVTSGSNIQIKNSIIAANSAATAQDCASTSGTAIVSDGYNLFGDSYGCNVATTAGDQEGNSNTSSALDPGLDSLQSNGGSTETHALQVSSPALNGADPAGCTDPDGIVLNYDQRGSGYPRTTTGTCDIGAYELQEYCGDGTIDSGEACDDGNFANNDGCSSTCQIEVCGDGVVQTSETCDDGNTISGDGCTSACILEVCGDGVINNNGSETCDDSNTANNDGCSSTCQVEVCGDGIVQASEACDDGNTINNDRCSNACRAASCGDGITQAVIWEQCDDGNRVNTDRCSNICRRPVCGDAIVQPVIGENCDDGNTRNGDGCSSRCLSE